MKVFIILFIAFLTAIYFPTQENIVNGVASFYHKKFEGRKTANGEIFSNENYTAAHKTLAFGTVVRVTHLKNQKVVEVRINDRLPLKSSRMIDLSIKAASDLNMIKSGLAKVSIEVINEP
ncbi:MAG: septal ring lytic transglycosylase RlpA family protein [Bacteroidetes bacterium]|nr:septal ring lytic transglycosylase RlpA family protein [Bacteroidota bacterium]HET6245737.1 septal ring lytic transglycosylase RlpA family protein [Bacteroidia bacterium]